MPVVQSGDDVIQFPDSMSPDDIKSALRQRYVSQALDFATKAPPAEIANLDRTLELGAEGADMGRRQAEKERLANEMAKTRIARDWGNAAQALLGGAESGTGFVKEMEPLNLLKRTMEIPAQLSGTDYKIQPLVSPEQARKAIDFFDPTADQPGSFGEGVKQFGSEMASGLTSPDQIAALAAGKANPELVSRLFQTQVASNIPSAAQQLQEALKSGDSQAIGKASASLAATVAIPAAIEHGIRGVKPEPGPTPELSPRFTAGPEGVSDLNAEAPETPPTPKTPDVPEVTTAQGVENGPQVSTSLPKGQPNAPETRIERQDIPLQREGDVQRGTPAEASPGSSVPAEAEAQGSGGAAEENVTPGVTQPELIGMGGAIPGEFDRTGSPTAMKYRLIDQERQQRGLGPLPKPEGLSDQQALDKAMAAIDRDPSYPDKLVADINASPKAIDDWQNHVLAIRHAELSAEFDRSAREAQQAYEDAQQFPDRLEDMERANLRTAQLSDKLHEVETASRLSGSARGSALRSLQVFINEDYSLAGLERQKRAAKGAPLTDAERSELIRISNELRESQKALEDYQAKEADRRVESFRKGAEEEAKKHPYVSPAILKVAKQLVSAIDTRADAARERLKARAGRFSSGVDPTVLVDLAEIGMSHIAHAGIDFAEWSHRMVGELGDWVKPHLDEVFKRSQAGIDALATAAKSNVSEVKKVVKGGFKALDLESQKRETVRTLKDRKNQDNVGYYAQRIARAFVERGVTDTQKLVDSVHEVLQEALPDITRRETMDAISGYGDYKQLSKDEITVKLRGMKGELQQLAKLEDMAKGQPPLKSGLERRTPTEAESRLIREVNEAKRKFQIPISDPETQLKSSLDTLKKALETRIKDYEERIAKGDYSKKPKRPIELDRRAQELQAQAEKIKRKFHEGLVQDRLAKRHFWEKALDWVVNYRRFGVLTSPTVLPKLISAGVQRLGSLPLEELAGSGIRRIPGASKVAEKAPLEGGGQNVKAELKGYGAAFTQGAKDAWNTLKEGHSDLDVLYGKREYTPAGEFNLGNAVLSFPGRLHGFLKAPIKRAVFERSVQRLGEFYAKQGLDVTDPLVKIRIGTEAYKAANAAIFLQDNVVASKLNAFLAQKINKDTGRPTPGSKTFQTAGRVLLPVTRVPINIVSEAFQYATGLATGIPRLGLALSRGVENLKPEEADLIMRELKKGSVGGAVLLMGYFNADSIGGYYQPGQKRDASDVKAGRIRIFGVDIPSWLLHNPLLETLQVGATIRRVADHIPANKTEPQGLGYGALAGALGVTEQIPFVKEQETIGKAMGSPAERAKVIHEMGRDIIVPQAVQWAAKQMDMTPDGELKRKTDTFSDYLKSGVPGLRQTLEPK